jgi:GAF domain-containing protein
VLLSVRTEQDIETIAFDVASRVKLTELAPFVAAAIPLVARGRAVGAIVLARDASNRRFGRARLEVAEEFARRGALAVDNALLMAAEQEANTRLRHLQAVTDAALDNLELDDLLRELLRRVRELTVADFASVYLHDPERGDTELTAADGLDGTAWQGSRRGEPESLAMRVVESGDAIFVEDFQATEFGARIATEMGIDVQSLLGVPMRSGDELVGVLQVGTLTEHRSFADPDVEFMTLVGQRAATAIANATLYDRAKNTSLLLQGSLLPETLPEIVGYEIGALYRPGQAGTEVGGDWYDVFPMAGERFAVVLGDVVGRGIPAAALMGQLRAATRAYAREHNDPATVLTRVDELVEELVAVPFATMVLLVLHPESGTVRASSAGHLRPILRSSGFVDLPRGVPLGAPAPTRESVTLTLDPGELLLLYSDGMVERRDEPIQDRLDALVAAVHAGPPQPSAMLDHVEREMLGGAVGDDAAALALRRL